DDAGPGQFESGYRRLPPHEQYGVLVSDSGLYRADRDTSDSAEGGYRQRHSGSVPAPVDSPVGDGLVAVSTIDFDAEFDAITSRLRAEREKRTRQPVVRIFDGNWTLRGRATHLYRADFQEIEWDTGVGVIEMPEEYYLSQWIVDHDNRPNKNVHVSVDKDGVRWSGRMDRYVIERKEDGKR